jgi:Flp pilus assembly protein TadD
MRRGTHAAAVTLALAGAVAPLFAGGQKAVDAEGNFNTGLAHMRENRPAMALAEFRKAISQDPKNPYFHKGLGLAYLQLGKFADAITTLRKALELNPYYVDVHNDLGTALILAGRREEGKAEFLTAFNDATNPTPDLSSRNLAQAYLEEKNYAQAANWFQTSINRNKRNPDAYVGLGESLLALGRAEQVIEPLEAAVKETPGQNEVLVVLGEAYYRAGRFNEARAKLEDVMRRDPVGAPGKRAADLLKHFPK